jgi:hypothetical protein
MTPSGGRNRYTLLAADEPRAVPRGASTWEGPRSVPLSIDVVPLSASQGCSNGQQTARESRPDWTTLLPRCAA